MNLMAKKEKADEEQQQPKKPTLGFRAEPDILAAVTRVCRREMRKPAQLIAILVREALEQRGELALRQPDEE